MPRGRRKNPFNAYPQGFVHVNITEVKFGDGKGCLLSSVDRAEPASTSRVPHHNKMATPMDNDVYGIFWT